MCTFGNYRRKSGKKRLKALYRTLAIQFPCLQGFPERIIAILLVNLPVWGSSSSSITFTMGKMLECTPHKYMQYRRCLQRCLPQARCVVLVLMCRFTVKLKVHSKVMVFVSFLSQP
jgi:hypothetical protein